MHFRSPLSAELRSTRPRSTPRERVLSRGAIASASSKIFSQLREPLDLRSSGVPRHWFVRSWTEGFKPPTLEVSESVAVFQRILVLPVSESERAVEVVLTLPSLH